MVPSPPSLLRLAGCAAALLLAPAARADAPPMPPTTVRALSPHGTCQAIAVPQPARITVQARGQPGRVLWSLPFWAPDLVLSDDCAVLGATYGYGQLLELGDKAPDTVVMRFFRQGQAARVVRLGELYPDLSVLPRTESHWEWLRMAEWSGQTWTAHTVDGRTLRFAP